MLWLGHVARMADNRLPKLLLFGQFSGPRKRGNLLGLRRLYKADILHLKGGVPDGLNWAEIAQDRNAWRTFVLGSAAERRPAEEGAPSAPTAATPNMPVSQQEASQPLRRSSRLVERTGRISSTPLFDPLVTPSGQPRRPPSSPYTGKPRGRPRSTGRGSRSYVPTGRSRGRPPGRKNRRHGY